MSIYTALAGKFAEAQVDYENGTVVKGESIREGHDLVNAKEKAAAIAKAKKTLKSAVDQAEHDSTGARAVGLTPKPRQSGRGTIPWRVKSDTAVADGFVAVRFKPIEGREDRAGGAVWRWTDGDNYDIVVVDGKPAIELDDGHNFGTGVLGVWTKADSVTAIEDFAFGGQ